jgi:hypothetical protein
MDGRTTARGTPDRLVEAFSDGPLDRCSRGLATVVSPAGLADRQVADRTPRLLLGGVG